MTETDQGQRAAELDGADSAGHPAWGPGPGSVGVVVTAGLSHIPGWFRRRTLREWKQQSWRSGVGQREQARRVRQA